VSNYDPLDQDAQDKARKDRSARDKLADQTEVEDVKWLMGSKRGRRILWRVLERAGVFRLSFNTNSMTMAFAEGARNEGLRMLATIHSACPDLYPTMLKEANE
jgi:hypothetical protein